MPERDGPIVENIVFNVRKNDITRTKDFPPEVARSGSGTGIPEVLIVKVVRS